MPVKCAQPQPAVDVALVNNASAFISAEAIKQLQAHFIIPSASLFE